MALIKQSPLFNHVVLRTIAEFLPQEDHLSARTVCQFWYQIFSKNLTVKLENDLDVSLFLSYHQKNNKRTKTRLENCFTKFDFSGWNNLKDLSSSPSLSLKFINNFTKLSKVARIRELSIPELHIDNSYQILFHSISSTIEVLNLHLPNNLIDLTSDDEDDVDEVVNEEIIVLDKVKTLIIMTEEHNEIKNVPFFIKILKSFINMHVLDMRNVLSSGFIFELKIFKCNSNYNFKKLKSIHLPNEPISEVAALNAIALINESNNCLLQEITYDSLPLVIRLTKDNILDYFHILAIYNPTSFPKMIKRANEYSRKQIHSIKIMDCGEMDQICTIPIKNLLFHFSSLEKLTFVEQNSNVSFNELDSTKKYPTLMSLEYKSSNLDLPLVGLTEKISEIFQNLTILNLTVGSEINFGPIFQNLTKLTNLSFDSIKSGLIGDEDLIGVSKIQIERLGLMNIKSKGLLYYKNMCEFHHQPSIILLKDLKSLKIDCLTHLNQDGQNDEKKLTKLSFYFGFSMLPNLENLTLNVDYLNRMPISYWKIFKDDFSSLHELTLHSSLANLDVFTEIKENRPNLFIKF